MSDELKSADFGDVRLTKRLMRVVEQLEARPEASFPTAAGSDGALEGTYRFLNNEDVTPQRILAPHVEATVQRARAAGRVIVAHDTTEFRFDGEREGMGWLTTSGAKGFFGHFALAMSADGTRRPLGVIGLRAMMRHGPPRNTKKSERRPLQDRESARWHELAAEVSDTLRGSASVVHVMDREADSYLMFSNLVAAGNGFVVRIRTDRRIVSAEPSSFRVDERMAKAENLFVREVPLSTRKTRSGLGRVRHAPRSARIAKLGFSAVALEIERPSHESSELPASLHLHVVRVFEIDAPPDVEPVEWKLITNEPIDTLDEVATIVDSYRARWVIEEFFKALKTGCAYEKRQLESAHALLNALAVFTPIAWSLLTALSWQNDPILGSADGAQSSAAAHSSQEDVAHRRTTIRDAMLAIAQLGGHIKNNGDPGWIVLGRGYESLLQLEEGARAVLEM